MAGFSDLPCELQIQIYKELLVQSPRLARMALPDDLRCVEPDKSGIRTLLQLNYTSRELALRHITTNSIPWTRNIVKVVRRPDMQIVETSLDQANFNRNTDLVYFDAWWQPDWQAGDDWETRGEFQNAADAAALVLGAEFPNLMMHLSFLTESGAADADDNPVARAMELLTDPRQDIEFTKYFAQLPAPQLPRNLYLVLEDGDKIGAAGREGFTHPQPEDLVALGEMTPAIQQTLHPWDRKQVKDFLSRWSAWSNMPDLQLPNVFFVLPAWWINQDEEAFDGY